MAKIVINPIVQRITQLRNEVAYSAAMGNYKDFKKAAIEHAKLAVENYDLAKQATSPKLSIPLFSKVGLNMLKVMFLNFFRVKTPEEKMLQKMAKENRLKQEVGRFIKQG